MDSLKTSSALERSLSTGESGAASDETSLERSTGRSNWRNKCRSGYRKHPWWYRTLLAVIVVVIIIVVAVPLSLRHETHTGIYLGSGQVAIDEGDESDTVHVFFEHASGQIRHIMWNGSTQIWTGGLREDNVLGEYASSPRKGTPLMAATYKIENETTWKVYYVDSNNTLQESVASTMTGDFPTVWSPGTLGLGQYKAHSSSHTGLSVCQNMEWFPDPTGFNNGSLVLFYGGDDGMNHMLTHEVQNTAWSYNHTFNNSSAASGIECTCRGDEILDTWMISEGQLMQASFNFNPSSTESVYRAGEWISGTVYGGAIQNSTSISAIKYTGISSIYSNGSTFVYYLGKDNIVYGSNFNTSDRSHTPNETKDSWVVDDTPIVDGSKIASVSLRTNSTNQVTHEYGVDSKVFLQLSSMSRQISVLFRNFWDATHLFALDGDSSSIGD